MMLTPAGTQEAQRLLTPWWRRRTRDRNRPKKAVRSWWRRLAHVFAHATQHKS
jgi:hypothetical protein